MKRWMMSAALCGAVGCGASATPAEGIGPAMERVAASVAEQEAAPPDERASRHR